MRPHALSGMNMRTATTIARGMAIAAVALMSATGCTVKKQEAPELTGPSELGVSLAITATPDVLTMDGASQAAVVVTARNSQSQPITGMGLRAEIIAGGQVVDYGRLSAKTASTGSDGRATFSYTAPTSPTLGNSDSGWDTITIRVIPSGNDFSNAVERTVDIRLVPQGIILPRPYTPVARFQFSPETPAEGIAVQFDAATSLDVIECPASATSIDECTSTTSTLVDYSWNFGDGSRGSGVRAQHAYAKAGAYTVTLTVTNSRGITASQSAFVTVGASTDPTATFTLSPTTPAVNQSIFFNASGSKAAPGRTLVAYDWTYGDGSEDSGVNVSHRYSRLGNFVVTLTVRDDIGKTGTFSQSVTVGGTALPTAVIALSPSAPIVGQIINFDGSQSTAPAGRTITSWQWSFGDGASDSGVTVSHRYNTAGDFTVILRVTDNTGATATASRSVTIAASSTQGPTAAFTVSPTPAIINQDVVFDASTSRAQGGFSIAWYRWNFGDSNQTFTCPGDARCGALNPAVFTYRYTRTGTFTVTLTVMDGNSREATVSRTIQVQ